MNQHATTQNDDLTTSHLVDLGKLYCESSRFDEALAFLNLALAADPNQHSVYYYRGVALFKLGQLKEALADFEKLMEGHPWNALEVLNYTGCIRLRLGDKEGARRDISRVLRANHGVIKDLVMTDDEYLTLSA